MALVPLATRGTYFHVYDFRVKPGCGDEFIATACALQAVALGGVMKRQSGRRP